MRAISLWQPWASLLALGLKRFESRGYAFPRSLKGQRVVIHAAKKQAAFDPAFVDAVGHYLLRNGQDPRALPFGAIVGTVALSDAFQIGSRIPDTPRELWTIEQLVLRRCPASVELRIENALGDFRWDRWAWECIAPRALPRPIPYSGKQGFFEVAPEAVAEIERQLAESPKPAAFAILRGRRG